MTGIIKKFKKTLRRTSGPELTLCMADGPPQSFHLAAGSLPCPLKTSTTAPPWTNHGDRQGQTDRVNLAKVRLHQANANIGLKGEQGTRRLG